MVDDSIGRPSDTAVGECLCATTTGIIAAEYFGTATTTGSDLPPIQAKGAAQQRLFAVSDGMLALDGLMRSLTIVSGLARLTPYCP